MVPRSPTGVTKYQLVPPTLFKPAVLPHWTHWEKPVAEVGVGLQDVAPPTSYVLIEQRTPSTYPVVAHLRPSVPRTTRTAAGATSV
jgi:hypothetical protein